jgi:hypothetical protein
VPGREEEGAGSPNGWKSPRDGSRRRNVAGAGRGWSVEGAGRWRADGGASARPSLEQE